MIIRVSLYCQGHSESRVVLTCHWLALPFLGSCARLTVCVLHPCVHIHVYMNMCAHMETTSQNQVSPPCFLKQGVPGNLEPQVSSCWCLPVLPGFLTWVLQSSWLYSRCSTTEPFTQPSLLVPDSRIDAYLLALSQPLLFLLPADSHPGPCSKREL